MTVTFEMAACPPLAPVGACAAIPTTTDELHRQGEQMTERRSRPFAEWLQEQRAGAAHSELSDALNELVEAVSETGKAGTLTIAVKVKPAGRGAGGTVLVTDSYNLKKPQPDRSEAVFFIDTDNNLTRHNPAQPSLPLREVPKNVDPDTGELREAK